MIPSFYKFNLLLIYLFAFVALSDVDAFFDLLDSDRSGSRFNFQPFYYEKNQPDKGKVNDGGVRHHDLDGLAVGVEKVFLEKLLCRLCHGPYQGLEGFTQHHRAASAVHDGTNANDGKPPTYLLFAIQYSSECVFWEVYRFIIKDFGAVVKERIK